MPNLQFDMLNSQRRNSMAPSDATRHPGEGHAGEALVGEAHEPPVKRCSECSAADKPSVSVIMPAFNEEGNLASSVESVRKALGQLRDFEVIIIDDCSHDATGRVADRLAQEDRRIVVVHNPRNMGLGYNYRKGVELARHDYTLMIPGDNEIPARSIEAIADKMGEPDMIIPYMLNSHIRPAGRRIISWLFVRTMNVLFGLHLRYFNGPCAIRSQALKTVPIDTNGFAYMAASLVRLMKRGHSYVQVGIWLQEREFGRSKALRPKNVASVAKTVLSLVLETRLGSAVAMKGAENNPC